MLNVEVASFSSFRDIKKNLFVTAEVVAEIGDSLKRKRVRVSLKNRPLYLRRLRYHWLRGLVICISEMVGS